tara:strand:- start:101 stop:928 length:828 start_codon:yes stop_codon:yes gene_type:complete
MNQKEIDIDRLCADALYRREFFQCTENNLSDIDNILLENEREGLLRFPKFTHKAFEQMVIRKKVLESLVSNFIKPGDVVLEGGAGKASKVRRMYEPKVKKLVGLEMGFEDIIENKDVDLPINGDLENIPLKSNYFDAVTTFGVAEHIEKPEIVFNEINRVLKNGGYLFIKTHSIYNPYMSINAVLPMPIREFLVEKVLGLEGDQFPAYYRCNSQNSLDKYLLSLGYERVYFYYYTNLFMIGNLFSYLLSLGWDYFSKGKILEKTKTGLLACYRKK